MTNPFIPHGHCYLWQTQLVGLHIVSDAVTAISYFLIALLLIYFVHQRRNFPFSTNFLLFGAFIVLCGITHLIEIWTLWYPNYWFSGAIKAATAIASFAAALKIVAVIPQALAIPSADDLKAANQALETQTTERQQAEQALLESESTLRSFYNSTEVMMGVVELLEDDILYISDNAATARFMGSTPMVLRSRRASELGMPPDAIDTWMQAYRTSEAEHRPVSFEYVHQSTDTDEQWLRATVCPIPASPGGRMRFSYMVENISDRKRIEAEHKQAEQSLRQYTAQLRQALEFESMLKRVTDKVRDSLDESQILDTVVQEIGEGLGLRCCSAALYDLVNHTSVVHYEYTTSMFPTKGSVVNMADFPEIYTPLLNGQYFQFCFVQPDPIRGRAAILACPLADDQCVLGDLWLLNDRDYGFRDLELRFVQQVANQCAIAIRQARLYHAAQTQVRELERLNQLKDDFLSTVSHELRTPISNIKLATQMLEFSLKQAGVLGTESQSSSKIERYFAILQEEGYREIALINDLLDLSRLEADTEPSLMTTIAPQYWLESLVDIFQERALSQQQRLLVEVEPDLPSMTTDLSKLERILMELLNNACKYTPAGETITVSLRLVRQSYALANAAIATSATVPISTLPMPTAPILPELPMRSGLTDKPESRWLQFSVSNSGVEIPPEERDRIFEKFYRIPNNDPWKHGGTGLGLALVKRRVESLGASIQVESRDRVTTFRVEIPLSDE
ncbi:PAS domain S-box protein [Oscillatoria sp. FACHB-1407]|uniref:sensor histidine kinase n=1 Tax=Oscillatoria sp. FACHB-1407 TaxID=2692847 RepID=UPI0016831290|nr:ATP-binding protein [Oscillatoria sp. FACHB-1407]MBD2462502.1 PAS domain S-box protein [Oscillatoria sp. FACHB-1407]